VYVLGTCRRIERVADGPFEGEEAVLHVMGDQIREPKRRTGPGSSGRGGVLGASEATFLCEF